MTELNKVTAVENTVNNILENNKENMDALMEEIEKENKKIEEATSAKESAKNSSDIAGYQKADNDLFKAKNANRINKELYSKMKDSPLISKEEYKNMVSDVKAEIHDLEEQTKIKLVELSDQMKAEAMQLQEATIKANEVLYHLQHDVYKDSDRTKNSEGQIIYMTYEDKKVDTWNTIDWGKSGVKHYQYFAYTGIKEEEAKPIYF